MLFKLSSKEQKLLLALVCLLALGLIFRFIIFGQKSSSALKEQKGSSPDQIVLIKESEEKKEKEKEEEKFIIVHITGAVYNPGIYYLPEGARAFQAVEKAGGALEEADLERVNLAQPLYDGQAFYVPRKGDGGSGHAAGGSFAHGGPVGITKININTADRAQLESLPGIGSVKAQNIISYREKNGPFKSIEDLLKVSGIGEKTLEGIRELITVY